MNWEHNQGIIKNVTNSWEREEWLSIRRRSQKRTGEGQERMLEENRFETIKKSVQ